MANDCPANHPSRGFAHSAFFDCAGVVVVTLAGELDTAVSTRLRDSLGRAVTGRPRAVLVDAAEVTFCSAGALSALLSAAYDAEAAEVPFALHTRARAILRPLRLLGLEELLLVHRGPGDARDWLHSTAVAAPMVPPPLMR